MKVVFAGTPEAALPTLEVLVASEHEVVAVLTQPDRPAGRGRHLTPSPVKIFAESKSLPVFQPEKIDAAAIVHLETLAPDVMVVVAYGLLIPKYVLTLPEAGCVNVHFSLLPRWRGASPIQQTLLHGDEVTGVTVMQLDEGLDTGPILLQEKYPVDPDENSQMLHDRLAKSGAALLLKTLKAIEQNTLHPVTQNATQATHAPKIKKSEGIINWQRSAKALANQIRAFNPWPVAFTYFQGERLRIWEARMLNVLTDRAPGTVISANKLGIDVATGDRVLTLLRVQLSGGRAISACEFLNAHEILPGETVFLSEGSG